MATRAPGPSAPPVWQDATCANPALPDTFDPDTDSILITRMHMTLERRKSGRLDGSGTAGQVTAGKPAAASYRATRASFWPFRCNCQTPSPTIVATASATMNVGITGQRVISNPPWPPRALDCDILPPTMQLSQHANSTLLTPL